MHVLARPVPVPQTSVAPPASAPDVAAEKNLTALLARLDLDAPKRAAQGRAP